MATDLDGTLLHPDGSPSERTCRAVQAAQAAGIKVVVATGRPPRSVRPIAQSIGAADLAICCNGAVIYHIADHAVIHHTPLNSVAARRLVEQLRHAAPGVSFLVERELIVGCEVAFLKERPNIEAAHPQLADALELCCQPVSKLIALHPQRTVAEMLALAAELAGAEAVVTHSGAPFVEISAPQVDKGWALADICRQQAIEAAEVVAFGDMPNDLAMLAWAGHAVAVANAHADVLASVDEVTEANHEDGVAQVLERLAIRQWQLPGDRPRRADKAHH